MDLYQAACRALLFRLPAESAHELGKWVLRWTALWRRLHARFSVTEVALAQDVGGLWLSNPVGLAPGFDKDCEVLDGLACLGFGFLEAGTVMRAPRRGNPRPRLLRDVARRALVNCMGLPSLGVDAVADRLRRRAGPSGPRVPVIVSMLGDSLDGYLQLFESLQPWVEATEIALRCPNTPDEPDFITPASFDRLIGLLTARKTRPIFVKLPTLDVEVTREQLLALVDVSLRHGVDGFVVSGTRPVEEPRVSMGRGSLSGPPVLPRTLHAVGEVYRRAGARAAVIAQGGITTGADAFAAIAAGASAVSVYAAFVYRGPAVARCINEELAALLRVEGIHALAALRGLRVPQEAVR